MRLVTIAHASTPSRPRVSAPSRIRSTPSQPVAQAFRPLAPPRQPCPNPEHQRAKALGYGLGDGRGYWCDNVARDPNRAYPAPVLEIADSTQPAPGSTAIRNRGAWLLLHDPLRPRRSTVRPPAVRRDRLRVPQRLSRQVRLST